MVAKQLDQLSGMEDLADPETIRSLVDRYGYKEAVVSLWPRSKAVVTLDARQREERIVESKRRVEEGEEALPPPPAATGIHRALAADYLDAALAGQTGSGVDALYFAVSYGVWELTDNEIRVLAGHLSKKLRTAP